MSEEKVKQEGEFKMKKRRGRPKKLTSNNEPTKLDLRKKEEDAVEEQTTNEVPVRDESGTSKEVSQENVEETIKEVTEESKEEKEEVTPLVEITEEPQKEENIETPVVQETVVKETVEQRVLPDNIEKLVKFMEETGGTIEDYVKVNSDYSDIDNNTLLKEYYKITKPHLDQEEISFIMEDNFKFDEEVDEERDVRKKKLAYKEEIAKAKNYLEDMKSKYYAEIKLRPGATQEQQKAMDFFNRYNEQQKQVEERVVRFQDNTKNYFNNNFEGFDFKVGEKRFRYKVKNKNEIATNQSDINNFIKKFLGKNGEIDNHGAYHKALYAADNADTIANHFYEQGKADAIKDMMAKSKNISTETRVTPNGSAFINGMKVKAISGIDSSSLKIKRRTNK
tara:strand:- start:2632 stop:3810 length:1179 start_codon:yes stop_codon:yes gene_type:complete